MDFLIRELMTSDPKTIAASAELDEAMHLMDRCDVRHLPVVETEGVPEGSEGALVGMLSDRDLLFATGWIPAEARRERFEPSGEGRPRLVRAVMSTPVATLDPEARIFDLALRFVTDRIGSVAVVEGGQLVGIATETDLIEVYTKACKDVDGFLQSGDTVGRAMSTSPVVVRWSTALDEAARAMANTNIRHLPVVEGGDVVGIVSDRDLRRAFGRGLVPETILEEIMTRDVATATPDTCLCAAADLMHDRAISSLPVVVDNTLVGIVTTTDLACHCLERFGAWSRSIA